MKLVLPLIFGIIYRATGLKVVVAGYNSKLAVYDVTDTSLSLSVEWDVGAAGQDMTWLQLDGDYIWAGHEVGEYEGSTGSVVSRWQISEDMSSIERQEYVGTGSVYTAHLLVDKDQGYAYAANYGGSTFSVIRLDGDGLGDLDQVFSYGENGECRDASHPHQTVTNGLGVWVVDLGCDKIWHYSVSDEVGGLIQTGETTVRAGAGPRHAVFHPTRDDLMFLLCELQSYVQVYRRDSSNGVLELSQELELSSTPGDVGAEILIGPSGKYVYGSSRGTGVVIVYSLEDDDTLIKIQEFNLDGSWPRSMAIRDNIMVVIDKNGDSLQLVNIDPDTGLLSGGPVISTPPQPSFVDFMN